MSEGMLDQAKAMIPEKETTDSQSVEPEILSEDPDWEAQQQLLLDLKQLLEEPIPKEDGEKISQTQLANRIGIPRSTVPQYVKLYEDIIEGKQAMHFIVRTKTNSFITERGVQFFGLIRNLRGYGLTHEYLQDYITGIIAKKPVTPTLNKSDVMVIANIVQRAIKNYADATIQEQNRTIENLAKINEELRKCCQELIAQGEAYQGLITQKEGVEALIEESRTQSSELTAQNQELMEQNRELIEQNKELAAQVNELLKREKDREMNEPEAEKKGFFAKLFGL